MRGVRGGAIALSTAAYVLVVLLPSGFLLARVGILADLAGLPLERMLPLFGRTLLLGALVTVLVLPVALLLATFRCGREDRFLLAAAGAALLVPPHVHLLSWMRPIAALERAGEGLWGIDPFGGFAASAWVQFAAFLPIAVVATLLGARLVDGGRVDAARVLGGDDRAFYEVTLPLVRPFAAVGALLVFLLSILDFSIPSHYQWNVLSLEILSAYSATGNSGRAAVLSLPLFASAMVLVLGALRPGERAIRSVAPGRRRSGGMPAYSPLLSVTRLVALSVFGLIVLTPFVSLAAQALFEGGAGRAVVAARREMLNSLLVGGAASLLSILLAGGPVALLGMGRGARSWGWALILAALALPAPLVGVALIGATQVGPFSALYGTEVMPILAATSRFAPWAALVLFAQAARRESLLEDAAIVSGAPAGRVLLRVMVPLRLPSIAAAAILVFALSMGELGATLLVAPPGGATLTMRLFNYMHYGAGGAVAGLALAAVLAVVLPGYMALRLLAWRSS